MTELDRAIAAAREAVNRINAIPNAGMTNGEHALVHLIAALDAARGEAVAWADPADIAENRHGALYTANAMEQPGTRYSLALFTAPPAALAVPADNVTPMRQPRADLARLVESINAAVYKNGDGLSVTEAIGALELAKLELLKEQEQ